MRLIVASGALQGDIFEITKDDVTIGRGANNDIVISDPATSRTHCQIRREEDKYVIQDANSANGTYINDERIALPYVLRDGDEIRLGETTLRVEDAGSVPVMGKDVEPAAVAGTTAGRRGGLWAAIAALSVIALLIAAVIMNQAGPAQVAAAATPTRASTAALAATATPIPATATSVPATLAPIGSVAPTTLPTATVAGVFTATETITGPVTVPASSTPVPGRNYPIPVPTLLIPVSGAKFTGSDPIQFSWSGGDLGPNEVYRVQVSTNNEFSKTACEIRTRDIAATIPGEAAVCTDLWQFGKQYFWRAQIVQRDALSPDPAGSTYSGPVGEFSWAP